MSNHQHNSNHSSNGHHDNHEHHIMPFSTYIKVAVGLFALTFLTVIVHIFESHYVTLAPFFAFAIAAVKAFLVMAWFMHLKYDEPSNRIIFSLGFIFLAVLFFFCSIDIFTRVAQVSPL
ncbi:MAG: cytochrome C oxidase subunit IV family protein [Pseudobdellovibrio sp.]